MASLTLALRLLGPRFVFPLVGGGQVCDGYAGWIGRTARSFPYVQPFFRTDLPPSSDLGQEAVLPSTVPFDCGPKVWATRTIAAGLLTPFDSDVSSNSTFSAPAGLLITIPGPSRAGRMWKSCGH